jgi:hypothetical protein
MRSGTLVVTEMIELSPEVERMVREYEAERVAAIERDIEAYRQRRRVRERPVEKELHPLDPHLRRYQYVMTRDIGVESMFEKYVSADGRTIRRYGGLMPRQR